MRAPKSIDVESLIAQTRAGLDHPIRPEWSTTKDLVAFLCDAMEALVGEVRSAARAAGALKSRLAAAEAEAAKATKLLRDADAAWDHMEDKWDSMEAVCSHASAAGYIHRDIKELLASRPNHNKED